MVIRDFVLQKPKERFSDYAGMSLQTFVPEKLPSHLQASEIPMNAELNNRYKYGISVCLGIPTIDP